MLSKRALNGCCYTSTINPPVVGNPEFSINVTVISADILGIAPAPVVTINFPWEFEIAQLPLSAVDSVFCQPPTYVENAQINCTTSSTSMFSAVLGITTTGVPTNPLSVFLKPNGAPDLIEECVFAVSCTPSIPPGKTPPLTLPPTTNSTDSTRGSTNNTDSSPLAKSPYLRTDQISTIIFSTIGSILFVALIIMMCCWRKHRRREQESEALYRKGVLSLSNNRTSTTVELTTAEQLMAAQIAERLARQYGGDQNAPIINVSQATLLREGRSIAPQPESRDLSELANYQSTRPKSLDSKSSTPYSEKFPPPIRHSVIQFGDLLDQFQMPQGREMPRPSVSSAGGSVFDMRRMSLISNKAKDADGAKIKTAHYSMAADSVRTIAPVMETPDWTGASNSDDIPPMPNEIKAQKSQTSTMVPAKSIDSQLAESTSDSSDTHILSNMIESPESNAWKHKSNSTASPPTNGHAGPSGIVITMPHSSHDESLDAFSGSFYADDDVDTPLSTPLLSRAHNRT
ncbi:hypothetical protein BATDEDRAFT_35667 [Batrachochytrium dendrobatidis JAM81]|uniref:Uncharacterized protein n=2 Tax=Batrachochytrium dendrobatidis TaxID=109871 RepID=F4P8J7_BATDJ|nr:uncharacterized protein BATDEDRAFT_35667 [Batrachochytrium dendrobatidis JAM81]EGF78501.1 hypothetical protein BATDEDRAFT_35667 [Batrachochytrium dendrobatidis JAM81]KAJ8324029.1 hypothetical protein O5D80_007249 [Batrachochytrium dendrobatidis]KAK5664831.1 hypothetical protein QVD99_008375 [Batrachochytrium dendrobatidis]OAJ43588.1 hypothetical protein BDEG_26933 [Batrachochytrium dendrobatidis JEL423]|eukprot:XP_006680782.1 hypothetical protein BATDEDRAFT_35667 [Batrachochytrium dendrobatidis JAM81]